MKAELIAAATGKGTEPKHTGLIYSKMDLIKALNHYNVYAKPENLKAWALTYLHKHHPDLVKRVEKQPMSLFGTYGALCRMSERGFDLTDEHKNRIKEYFELMTIPTVQVEEVIIKPAAVSRPKYTRSREAFEMAIDETLETGKVVTPSLIMSESHKDIVEICQKTLKDIEEAPEYFGSTKTLQQKFFKQVLEKVNKARVVKKGTASTIVKNPSRQVAGVKYLRKVEFNTFSLRSVDPIDTLERKKMYVYDAKYRRIIVFVALTAAGFQYSGTTLKNVDLTKSFSKTIRKPAEFFKFTKIGIAELNKAFDGIKAKEIQMPSARFNTDWLILKVTEKGA